MDDIVTSFDGCFEEIRVKALDLPVCCSVVYPSQAAFERWPGYPAAAKRDGDRTANGRGFTWSDCSASGIGEAIELACCCEWPDEAILAAPMGDVADRAIAPHKATGFSQAQYANRQFWNEQLEGLDWVPQLPSASEPLDWMEVIDVRDGRTRLAPADVLLIGRRAHGEAGAVAVADSNGCAAGRTAGGAQLAAVLELVERDATHNWWYGLCAGETLRIERLPDCGALAKPLAERRRQTRLLRLSSAAGIPCVAALSWEPDGRHVAPGFAAGPTLAAAALSALTEMVQMEHGIGAALAGASASTPLARWMAEVDSSVIDERCREGRAETGNGCDEPPLTPDAAMGRCIDAGWRIFLHDRMRPEFAVPVWRALSPDAMHWKPRFAGLSSRASPLPHIGRTGLSGCPLLA